MTVADSQLSALDVVVAVIRHPEYLNQFFICQRKSGQHLAGFWEFPGGKCEKGETHYESLQRELHEEVGITIEKATPIKKIIHQYKGRQVVLNVWEVLGFSGKARGCEGQQCQWAKLDELNELTIPAANQPIIDTLHLPQHLLITPSFSAANKNQYLDHLERLLLQQSYSLIQFRAPDLDDSVYFQVAAEVKAICDSHQRKLQINRQAIDSSKEHKNWHLPSQALMRLKTRPSDVSGLMSASCHNFAQLQQAEKVGCDFVLLSNVKPTLSHVGKPGLGWQKFGELAQSVALPVYALGGVSRQDLSLARNHSAFGVAGIRDFWLQNC